MGVEAEPLTSSNRSKATTVRTILDVGMADDLKELISQDPGMLIGLRIDAAVDKPGLFWSGQRGIITDLTSTAENRIYVAVTWENLPTQFDFLPMQRTVRFRANKLFKYVHVAM